MKIKNLLIIGNGFDLAHGLKTDYKSFITDYLISERLNVGPIKDSSHKNDNSLVIRYFEKTHGKQYFTGNIFIYHLLLRLNIKNWVDIESLYFELLSSKKYETTRLNNEFSEVKDELEEYLEKISSIKKQNYLSSYFDKMSKKKEDSFLAINFNYTNTFDLLYKGKFKECPIINIHGELKNSDNPIIFGYAPTDDETIDLIKNGDNELLKNIKRYYYKRTDSESRLNQFLKNDTLEIHVHILGHSCGVSDRNILKDIFINKYVKKINIMYHKNYDNYFDTLVNIDRVVENNKQYGIINNYQKSIRMPQFDDGEEDRIITNQTITNFFNQKHQSTQGVDIR